MRCMEMTYQLNQREMILNDGTELNEMKSCYSLARPRNAYYPFPDGYLLKEFGPRRSRKQLSRTF